MPRIHQINVGGTSYSIVDSSNIATLEYGPNASVPYAKNDYVIWMDQLYKVIAPIAINAPFIINTNIKSTTVSEELHSGGHMILDDQGDIMDQRQNLQFPGMTVEDSEVGNKTVVRGYVRYETMEEAEEHADDIQDWARVIVDEADYVGVIDDHLDAESPNPVKNSVVTEAINAINDSFAVVTGTMASTVNTEVTKSFPTGFDGANTVIVGNIVKNGNSALWYSSHSDIKVFIDQNSGIRIKTTESGFCNQPFKVLIKKI